LVLIVFIISYRFLRRSSAIGWPMIEDSTSSDLSLVVVFNKNQRVTLRFEAGMNVEKANAVLLERTGWGNEAYSMFSSRSNAFLKIDRSLLFYEM
jgi:hypothetical protein